MIIEFELQGSKCLHKGMFETTGFWVKYEEEMGDDINSPAGGGGHDIIMRLPKKIIGYKLYSHFSFAFYHEDKGIVDRVYSALMSILKGEKYGVGITGIGYIKGPYV